MNTQTGKLLLDEPPLIILPSLAEVIGLEPAVVLQQLHFLIRSKLERHKDQPKDIERDVHDGRVWIWNSYQQWKEKYFRFISVRSLQRIFLDLERRGLIVSGKYNQSSLDKTKWYSVVYDHPLIQPLGALESKSVMLVKSSPKKSDRHEAVVDHANVAPSTSQVGASDSAKLAQSYTKTSVTKIPTNITTTTTPPESSSSNHNEKKDTEEFRPMNTFPIPETPEEADQIVKDVINIVYPLGERIRNKNNLVASLKKKLKAGVLEIPEGWKSLENVKREKERHDLENKKYAEEGKAFPELRKEFENLSTTEQNAYMEAARKNAAKYIYSVESETIIPRLAITLWSQDRNKKSDIQQEVY